MARIKGPLYSLSAQGTFGGGITFQSRGLNNYARKTPHKPPPPKGREAEQVAYFKWAQRLASTISRLGIGFAPEADTPIGPWERIYWRWWSAGGAYPLRRRSSAVNRARGMRPPPFGPGSRGFIVALGRTAPVDYKAWLIHLLLLRAHRSTGNRFVDDAIFPPEAVDLWQDTIPPDAAEGFSLAPPSRPAGAGLPFNAFFVARQTSFFFRGRSRIPGWWQPVPFMVYGKPRDLGPSRYEQEVDLNLPFPYIKDIIRAPRG